MDSVDFKLPIRPEIRAVKNHPSVRLFVIDPIMANLRRKEINYFELTFELCNYL